MNHLLRFTLLCMIALIVLLTITLVAGRTAHAAPILTDLKLCEQVPCYGGIVLGQTPLTDAPSLIPQQSTTDIMRVQDVKFVPDGYRRVRRIDLIIAPKTVTAGEIVRYYGPPCAVISVSATSIETTYPGIGFFFDTVDWRLESTSRVSKISTFIPMMPCVQATNSTARIWHGFKRYPRLSLTVRR